MSQELQCTPPELVEIANSSIETLIPTKSRKLYDLAYEKFLKWCNEYNVQQYTENVMLAYFTNLSRKFKSSTLWAQYSMIKSQLNIKHNVKIEKYSKLIAFIKRQGENYTPKKSKVLTQDQFDKFLKDAPNNVYLATKLGASDEDNLKDIFVFPKDRKSSLLPRVKGGENASPHLYPYQAALYITTKKMSRFFCGGTLIDTNWILTAAHCVVDSFLYVSVYLGSHNLADKREVSRQVYYTSKVFVHENWRPFQNDIALIKLLENAILNDYVSLVNISTTNETYAGENSIIIGWGATETAARSNILKKVEVLVMSNDQCKSINENYKSVIKDTHLCTASLDVKGSCKGDSGGPLIVNNKQIGIVSFGSVSCIKPSVFTRVSKFSDWITYTMQNDSSKLSAQIILLPLLISFSICIGF